MREVSFFWKIDRLDAIGLESILDVAKRIEFLSYIKRVPKDIRCLFKFHLHEGQSIDDLQSIESLEILEVVQEAENPDEGHLEIRRVIHPHPILNARTNGTYAVAAPNWTMRAHIHLARVIHEMRLLSGVLRLMAKPDRTSARTLKLTPQNRDTVLTEKQLSSQSLLTIEATTICPSVSRSRNLLNNLD